MLKELLCLCFCLAVVLAQDEPPNEPAPELHARNRREAPEMFNSMMTQAGELMKKGIDTMQSAASKMAEMGSNMPNMPSGSAPAGRRRREMEQPPHPHPPPHAPNGGDMPHGQ